jgi:L-lysine exporter family protein LysE/ArgO
VSPVVSAALAGAGLGASLIIAIGAQNAFVLRRGIRRDHVLAVVAVCILCDWVLIALGAAGFGALISAFPLITRIAAWAGAAFLTVYGAMAFRSALHPGALTAEEPAAEAPAAPAAAATASTTRAAIVATLAISLLNPHVYLDTVVLLGSLAAQYEPALRVWFTAGAMLASAVWFAGLGFGARLLAPVFERPVAWRVLDVGVGLIMWWIALGLVLGQVR